MATRTSRLIMETIVVVKTEILSALGDLIATWQGLVANRHGFTRFQPEGESGSWPVGMVDDLSPELGDNDRLQAMLAKLLVGLPSLPPRTSLLCATTKGAVDELLAPENDSRPGQPWEIAKEIADRLGITHEYQTVSGACASGTLAIIQAAMRLRSNECDVALVVGIDLLSRFVLGGFASLQALSPTGCKPFDVKRDGLTLGEGGGWMLMTTKTVAEKNKWPVIAELTGFGSTCDATHITAPCRNASGLIATLKQVTADGTVPVGGINAHGTGTSFNDAMELLAFTKTWSSPPPICSVKGAIGHCLGAAGVIEAAVAIKSLQTGVLPPTVGLINVDNDNITASGKESLPLLHNSVISCNSGFGGINAAVLFASPAKK